MEDGTMTYFDVIIWTAISKAKIICWYAIGL